MNPGGCRKENRTDSRQPGTNHNFLPVYVIYHSCKKQPHRAQCRTQHAGTRQQFYRSQISCSKQQDHPPGIFFIQKMKFPCQKAHDVAQKFHWQSPERPVYCGVINIVLKYSRQLVYQYHHRIQQVFKSACICKIFSRTQLCQNGACQKGQPESHRCQTGNNPKEPGFEIRPGPLQPLCTFADKKSAVKKENTNRQISKMYLVIGNSPQNVHMPLSKADRKGMAENDQRCRAESDNVQIILSPSGYFA